MSLLLVGMMTEQMFHLVAFLQKRDIRTALLDDVETGNGALDAANPYSIVLIGSDIKPHEASFLISQVLAMKRRLPVVAMHP